MRRGNINNTKYILIVAETTLQFKGGQEPSCLASSNPLKRNFVPWHQSHRGHGYTWPLLLEDPAEINDFLERIDFTFSNSFEADSIERTGTKPVHGFLDSDHAGAVAVFELEKTPLKDKNK